MDMDVIFHIHGNPGDMTKDIIKTGCSIPNAL